MIKSSQGLGRLDTPFLKKFHVIAGKFANGRDECYRAWCLMLLKRAITCFGMLSRIQAFKDLAETAETTPWLVPG